MPNVEVIKRIISGTQNNKVGYGGNIVTYEVELTNTGQGTAWDVYLNNRFPSGFTFVAGSCISTTITCSSLPGWEWLDSNYFDLAPGATTTLQFQLASPINASIDQKVSSVLTTSWRGTGQSSYHYPTNGTFNYNKQSTLEVELIQPTYSLIKGPKKTDGALIVENGKGEYQLTFTNTCLLYTSPSPRDRTRSRMPSSA